VENRAAFSTLLGAYARERRSDFLGRSYRLRLERRVTFSCLRNAARAKQK